MVVGGKVTLRLAPGALADLAGGRVDALVSATNGKTSTTRLLATAASQAGPVATQSTGANMTEGVLWALANGPSGAPAILEVDEAYLPRVVAATRPRVVLLANLSRDQLDRMSEVAMLARKWRRMLEDNPDVVVVANADDPIVAFAAEKAQHVIWVAAGQAWTADSSVCPECGTLLSRDGSDWSCPGCGRARPKTSWQFEWEKTGTAVGPDGQRFDLSGLQLPGRFNASNATMALAVCAELGLDLNKAVTLMNTVTSVSGRFATVSAGSLRIRLLLAKNPAGWSELLDIMPPAPTPVIVIINSNDADGRDPSWLWDVPFERLRGRTVIASGNRRRDLAVRLLHAGVDAVVIEDPFAADAELPEGTRDLAVIDCAATYTAFQKLRDPSTEERTL
jgi:UDP-N-acetylmuramyl tripeptide synthase